MSTQRRTRVDIYYDVISPYARIGFEVLLRYRHIWNIEVKLKPFFLGGIMQGSGNTPPGRNPAKAAYGVKDLRRLSKHFKIPLHPPSNFAEIMNSGSLAAQRFITAVDMKSPERTEDLSYQIYLRVWTRDEDITRSEGLAEAARRAGLTSTQIQDALTRMTSQEVKDRLRACTQEALDLGAFGAPTFVIHHDNGEKEMVFGSDRFHIIADLLGRKYEGPLNELAKL